MGRSASCISNRTRRSWRSRVRSGVHKADDATRSEFGVEGLFESGAVGFLGACV